MPTTSRSSAEGIRFARGLGITRVIVPRELSTAEIRRLAGQTDMEAVHEQFGVTRGTMKVLS